MFCARPTEESTFYFLPFLWQAGGDVDRLDGPEAEAALQFLVDLVASGVSSRDVLNSAVTEGASRIISGTVAMSISGPWDIPHVAKQATCDWSVEQLPVRGDGTSIHASVLGGWNWAVPQGAQNPDGAWQLIEWMSRPEQMSFLWPEGHLPPRTDVIVKDPAAPQAFRAYTEQLAVARQRGPYPHWPDLSQPIQTALQQAISGQVPTKEALKRAAGVIGPILQKTPLSRS
jgi:multiple sugar transport system substrate-binding protein